MCDNKIKGRVGSNEINETMRENLRLISLRCNREGTKANHLQHMFA